MDELRKQAHTELTARRSETAEAIVACQFALQPEKWATLGERGRAKCIEDTGYHLDYLAQALWAGDPTLFTDYAAWAEVLFAGLNLPGDTMAESLKCTGEVLQRLLPEAVRPVVAGYIEAAQSEVANGPRPPASWIDENAPLGSLAHGYLDALLARERTAATRMIAEAVDRGVELRDLYLKVFQPCLYEIGRLWQMNQLGVAEEHYCTAVTQAIISQHYPRLFEAAGPRNGRKMIAAAVAGELHEMGVRMVADFFELEGWDTYYLGANTPTASLVRTIETLQPDVLAISAALTLQTSTVADLISRVRASGATGNLKILVGGYVFNRTTNLWREVGADATAANASLAVAVTNDLLSSRSGA